VSAASDADKELVRSFLDNWSNGDLDEAFDATDPEGLVWMLSLGQDIRMGDWTDRIRTKASALREGTRYAIELMTSEDGRVSVIASGSSVLADGTPYANRYHYLFAAENGLIVRVLEFSDPRLADAAFRGGKAASFEQAQ
jgi:ketosteroid isomerase-like protein